MLFELSGHFYNHSFDLCARNFNELFYLGAITMGLVTFGGMCCLDFQVTVSAVRICLYVVRVE